MFSGSATRGVRAAKNTVPLPEFETLFEAHDLPRFDLPEAIEHAYGGFGLAREIVYGNFVSSIDGVAAIPGVPRGSAIISGGAPADRFVVALLRAAADAIVIGAGTFRAHEGPWTAEHAYPDAAAHLAALRRQEGAQPLPKLVVLTASGDVDGPPAKLDDTTVITTTEGANRIAEHVRHRAEVIELSPRGSLDMRDVFRALTDRGYGRILTEGGPTLMGASLRARAVDEMFLTVSPVIAGGGQHGPRPTLAAGVDLLPDTTLAGRLLSVRHTQGYLFLRYAIEK